jgi:hypothetical protein
MDKEILGKRESAKSAIIMFPLTMLDNTIDARFLLLSRGRVASTSFASTVPRYFSRVHVIQMWPLSICSQTM